MSIFSYLLIYIHYSFSVLFKFIRICGAYFVTNIIIIKDDIISFNFNYCSFYIINSFFLDFLLSYEI